MDIFIIFFTIIIIVEQNHAVSTISQYSRIMHNWLQMKCPVFTENSCWYVTSHLGQLSLAIPSRRGSTSTSERVLTPCRWGVKAGMVHVWVLGKTV